MDIKRWRHDLKTPIQAQHIALTELLTERPGPLTPIQKEFISETLKANKDILDRIETFTQALEDRS